MMNHLTTEKIIAYVSAHKMDKETLSLMSEVTAHIRCCHECFKLVDSFQLIYDEFEEMSLDVDFGEYARNIKQQEKEDDYPEL